MHFAVMKQGRIILQKRASGLSPMRLPTSKLTVREERHWVNEECFWCLVGSQRIARGMIVNESASGILLRSGELVEIGKKILVLSIPSGLPPLEPFTVVSLQDHPMTRTGQVVRTEGTELLGIQFLETGQARPEFRRWFRGKGAIALLTFPEQAIFNLSGHLTLEVAALFQTLMIQQQKRVKDIVVACHELEEIAATASTIFRSMLHRWDQEGGRMIWFTGSDQSCCQALNRSVELRNGLVHQAGDRYASTPVVPQTSPETSAKAETPAPPTPTPFHPVKVQPLLSTKKKVVLIARGQSVLNRMAIPFDKYGMEVMAHVHFMDAIDRIEEEKPLFVVIDVELDQCNMLVELNRLRGMKPGELPPLLIFGPSQVGDLVKAAIQIPIHSYHGKPYTDRDYHQAIQGMMKKLGLLGS